MINEYPLWKYLLILFVVVVGGIYALPNLYGNDPAVQISGIRGKALDDTVKQRVRVILQEAGTAYKSLELSESRLLVRFNDTEVQLQARDSVAGKLGDDYIVAVNLAASTPAWLQAINALPMYLGLDLRGGVHFLMEVDMNAVVEQANQRYRGDIRGLLRKAKIRYSGLRKSREGVVVEAKTSDIRDQAHTLIRKEYPTLVVTERDVGDTLQLIITLSEQEKRDIREFAIKQNLTSLRNRVNELGVAEPIIQQQGQSRIVVQLPGVQDTARAKRILGATATLEYRAADFKHNVQDVIDSGRVPAGFKLYKNRKGSKVLLRNSIIATGNQIVNARSGFDQETGSPMVSVTLDAKGARKMLEFTK
ncbi:MAG: protein translocase subunit SecD, partial [Gammaproteobacteria bacterium]